jgi:hypothetical protein
MVYAVSEPGDKGLNVRGEGKFGSLLKAAVSEREP